MLNRQLKPSGRKPASRSPAQVHYPESDGKPLAESDTHLEEVVSIRLTLRAHFASRSDVYISGLNLIYYVEGDPKKCFSPDVYVTLGIERGLRRVYLTWIEGKLPDIAFEVTSKKTRRRDIHDKRILYQQLGIPEYVLYDPELDYLKPPFQLWRLQPNPAWRPDDVASPRQIYQAVEPDEDRTLFSQALNLKMKIVDQHVRFIVPETNELLPLPADDAEARREAEASLDFLRRRTIQESNKRIEAEARAIVYAEQARLMEEQARRLEEQAQHLSDETRRLARQARTDAEARAEAEARAQAEVSARAEAEARAQAEVSARAEAEARAQAEVSARAEAEARAQALQARLQQLEALLKSSSSL